MARDGITEDTELRYVEHILGSGSGTLDFAVEGEPQYRTWDGTEEAEWTIEDVDCVENAEEDRVLIYPEEDYFICDIETDREEGSKGEVYCRCE